MNERIVEVATAVEALVAPAPLLGSQLAAKLRVEITDWDPASFGVRNLKEFISRHVPSVVVARRSGMDVVYATAGTEVELSESRTPPPQNGTIGVWRVWLSPRSPYALAIDADMAGLHAIHRAADNVPGDARLDPPDGAFHRSLAHTFLRELAASPPGLVDAANSTARDWWQTWSAHLETAGHLSDWMRFRSERFAEHLVEGLVAKGVSLEAAQGIVEHARADQPAKRMRIQRVADRLPDKAGDELRRVVLNAIGRMSSADLRDLRLPVGVVLDVIAESAAR